MVATVTRHARRPHPALRAAYAERSGGDSPASTVPATAFMALGTALAPWYRRFAPTVVVVGGAMAAAWDLLGEYVRAGLSDVTTHSVIEGAPGAA